MTDLSGPAARTPADETYRSITMGQMGEGRFKAVNRRGGVLPIGSGEDPDFTPVELLLAALAGCGAIDLEDVVGRRSAFTGFDVLAEGHKVRDEQGSHLVDLRVTLTMSFPDDDAGAEARAVVQRTLQQIEDRVCTVGRTVTIGAPVAYVEGPARGEA